MANVACNVLIMIDCENVGVRKLNSSIVDISIVLDNVDFMHVYIQAHSAS